MGFSPFSAHLTLDLIITPLIFSFLIFSSSSFFVSNRSKFISVDFSKFAISSCNESSFSFPFFFYKLNKKLFCLVFPFKAFLKIADVIL